MDEKKQKEVLEKIKEDIVVKRLMNEVDYRVALTRYTKKNSQENLVLLQGRKTDNDILDQRLEKITKMIDENFSVHIKDGGKKDGSS